MKTKLRKILIRMSKFAIYGIVIQMMLYSFAFAVESSAQKSLNDIQTNIGFNDVAITKALKSIASITDFQFAYRSREIPNLKINVDAGSKTLTDLLRSISQQSGLSFRRIDKVIHVKIAESSVDAVVEIISEELNISGRIIDENGEPLPGASIVEKGTTNGATTDLDGRYRLTLSESATIVISFVGYETQEILVGNQSVIDLQMKLDASQLEEIIVVGYGTSKLRDITGSVVMLDLENSPASLSPNSNVLQSLRGKLSGVNIGTQNNVGETPNLLVRGQNSINGSNAPLIVLDGVIFLGDIADINPGDIGNISVLKDASAAAAYGSRSANGVIMINTKEGKSDKPTIRYNTTFGVNTWRKRFDMMETPRYLEKYAVQNNYATVDDIVFDDAYRNILLDQRVNTNWVDLVAQKGFIQDHQVSVSGKSEKMDYFFSGGYVNQKGAIVGDSYQRISVRSRLNVDVTSWLKVGIDGSYNNNDYSGIGADVFYAGYSAPIGLPYRYDGMPNNVSANTSTDLERWAAGGSYNSPLWGTDGTIQDVDKDDFFRFSGFALIKVPKIEGLTYRLNYATYGNYTTRNRFNYEDYYIQEATTAPYYDRYSATSLQKGLTQANGYNINQKDFNYVIDNIINYNKEFGDHYFDATLVATRDFTSYKTARWNGSNFAGNGNTVLGVNGLAFADVQTNSLVITERANVGYLARLGYTFQQKYHLNASYRRDGASVFGADRKWGNFPSVGVAWTVSEEGFLKGNELVDYLKVKASYGVNGNQGVDPYETLAPVSSGQSGAIRYEFGNAPSTILYGIRQNALANPNLGWEKTTSFNGGLQSAWMDNKLFLDVDFYFSKTVDQIFSRQIPIMTGFTSITSSLGQVDNNGIEINLRYNLVTSENLNWSSNLTYWRNRNTVVKLYGDDIDGDGVEEDDIANNLFIGQSLGAIFGYDFVGVVQETDTEYIANNGGQAGDPMFRDLDGDNVITAADRKVLGFDKENFRLGFANTLSYKNFSLYVMVSGIFGGGGFYQKSNPFVTSFRNRFDTNELDHDWWTPENKSTEFLRPGYIGGRYLGIQSRTFVRIQDVTLSYMLPTGALSSIGVSSLKVYGTVNNLFTFTKWGGGGDPEEGVAALQDVNSGESRSNIYPVPTVYSLGLNVSF